MNHSLTTSAYINLLLKDGLTLDDIKTINEKMKEMETLFNQLFLLLSDNEIKGIRIFLRRNNEMRTLKSCELNEDYSIDEHKFVIRNGRLRFFHDS